MKSIMASELTMLLLATLISSAALLLIGVLRAPLRHAFGARAAYWVWLLAPASIMGLFAPRLNLATAETTQTISSATGHAWQVIPVASTVLNHIDVPATFGLLLWLAGVLAALCITVFRQQRFVHALAPLSKGPDGTLRSGAIVMPLVIGAWPPRLIIPLDFERRYSESRRKLMLAHEAMHLARWDTPVAALAAGWACIFWFNPLVYWAVSRLRFDQELACDATVLSQFNGSGRDYATALLDAQMANQMRVAAPVGCHWQSAHPLKQRIAMLRKKLPGHMRTKLGVAVAIAISVLGSAAVWAAQPQNLTAGSPVVLSMIWFADHDPGFPGRIVRVSVSNRLVHDGEELASMSPDRNYEVACTPRALPHGTPPREPTVIVRCKLGVDGRVFAEPATVIREGQLVALDMRDPTTGTRLYVVLSASTSRERVHQAERR
jgi:beta-lactamase regulating signal transducer with metallopeptidase domain